MGKIMWGDVWNLTKVRAKEAWIHWQVAVWLFLGVLVFFTATSFFQSPWNGAQVWDVPVFANWMMFAAVVFAFGETRQYREYNQTIGMFPQSNQTRFWSYVVLIHGIGISLVLTGIVLYSLFYLIFAFPGSWFLGIKMAYAFDLGLVLASLAVSVSYVCVICAVLACLEAVYMYIGKWFLVLLWAFVVFCLMGSGFGLRVLATYVLPFWSEETSLIIFFLKILVTWCALMGISWWLAKHTSYYQQKKGLKLSIWSAVVLVGIFVIIVMFNHTIYIGTATTENKITDMLEGAEKVEYEFSLNGDAWKSCTVKRPAGVSEVVSEVEKNVSAHIILTVQENRDCEKGTIQIKYRPPSWLRNEVELASFYNHEVMAKVNEKGQLYIEYHSEAEHSVTELPSELNLCFLSPCGIYMNSFSMFQGKTLYKTINGTSGGIRDGYLIILYPPGEELEIVYE